MPTRSATPSTLEHLPVYFYLITGRIQLDCFDRSVYSQCALYDRTWLKFRKSILFVLAVVYEQKNNNCQGYDFSLESLLLSCNKPLHFSSRSTNTAFPLINFYKMRHANMN